MLHVPPVESLIHLQTQSDDSRRQRRTCARPGVGGGARVMEVGRHHLALARGPRAVGRGQGRGTGLRIPKKHQLIDDTMSSWIRNITRSGNFQYLSSKLI